MKGLETPTPVYELTGIVPARSRFQASAARGLTQFVGRESELQQLAQALERAAAGHGQAVAVVGEAGVGKSRLVWEFTRSHRTHGWLVLESGSVSYGKATPYLPVIELLKAYCQVQERDAPRAIRERVAGKLLMLDRALEPLLTPLLALLDVPIEEAAWDTLDPPQRRQRTLEAVKRLLLRESQIQPLLLIFEDLHWIDTETQALLDGLIESLPTARVLLLVNYRPEYQHGWGSKTYYTQLRIDPLPPESAEELLTALLGQDRTLDPLKRVLIARTEGNPFFLEESVRTLVETQVLVGERGAYRMTKAPDAWQIPATAQAILAARIDRLAPEDKRLLQAASVIGKDVPFALLEAIADMPEDSLRRRLSHLQAAEFLYETSLFPDLEYTFRHALTHEVAYGSVLQERRRMLHARIADAIEALYPERLTEQIERLAHHALRGEVWGRAVGYLRQAGAKASARSANRETVACFEQALEAWRICRRRARRPSRASICGSISATRSTATESSSGAGSCSARPNAWPGRSMIDRRLGWVYLLMSQNYFTLDEATHQRAAAEQARTIGQTLADVPSRSQPGTCWVRRALTSGSIGGLRTCSERSCRRSTAIWLASVWPVLLSRGAMPGPGWREPWPSAAPSRTVSCTGRTRSESPRRSVTQPAWATPSGSSGTCRAQGGLRPGRSPARTGTRGRARGPSPCAVGAQCGGPRRCPRAVGACGGGPRPAAMDPGGPGTPWTGHIFSRFLVDLGNAYIVAGRLEDARASAGRALALTRAQGQRGHETYALRLLGEIAARGDPLDAETAEGYYRQALTLATELEMRPLVAHCHLGLGKLYRRTGDHAKAQRAPDDRDDHVPRDGHGVLAGEGGGGLARGLTRCPAPRDQSATMPRRRDI